MKVYIKNIPTYIYEEDRWTTTSFESQKEFHDFIRNELLKECGEYEFDECSLKWNEVARNYYKNKQNYCLAPEGTRDFIDFWEFEKKKCRLGVIWKHKDKTWYTPREYYMLLNFLPVTNKEKGSEETHIDIRDTQYHMGLYKILSKLAHKHSAIVKKRQMLFSYYHCAEMISTIWFEKNKTLKMFASDESYIDDVNGSWKILNDYKDHLNKKTAWYRMFTPCEPLEWQQKERIKTANGRWVTRGNRSSLIGKTLNKDPKKGVGGPCWLAWYEEGGIAPTADTTLQYMNPALESGLEKSGCFTIGGSVGDLKECTPLQNFIKYPDTYEMYKIPTKWYDKSGLTRECGLFIPTQHGMPPFVDQYGNSLVQQALAAIEGMEKQWQLLPASEYRLKKSQNPTTLEEAFAFREDLYFPTRILQRQQDNIKIRVENRTLKPKHGVLSVDAKNVIKFTPLSELQNAPLPMEFPVNPETKDKRGVVTIYEDPPKNPDYLVYFAGVDSIEKGITSTSKSLFSTYIVRRGIKKVWYEEGVKKEKYEPPKLCASYVGRYDDDEDTNEQGELLIRLYNAFAAVERNKPNFINHMRRKLLAEKHVMKRKDLTLFKDVDSTGLSNDEYGIYFGADNKAEDILNSNIKEHLTQPLDVIYKKDSQGMQTEEVMKTYRGADFIDDYWLLEELKLWYHGLNTDRRVGYGLAIMAAGCYEMSYVKVVKEQPEKRQQQRRESINLLGNSRPMGNKRRSLI